jgi:hypothetical protein
MAIEYSFWLDSDMTLSELADLLSQIVDLRERPETVGQSIVLLGEEIVCYLQRGSERGRELSRELFAIESRLSIACRMVRYPDGMPTLYFLCTDLLRRLACDLVMINDQGPKALLLRKQGRIVVDVRSVSIWKEAVRALGGPYDERELPAM